MTNDPKFAKVDLDKLRVTPEDPATGEPQDKKPLYYRSRAKSIILEDGRTVQEAVDDLEDGLENHTHNAADIITDEDHQFVTQEEKDKLMQGTTYSNDIPTYVEHGGIEIGTTFQDKTMKEMFDMILYPYVAPTVSASVLSPGNGGTFEIGSTVNVTKIRVTATIKSNKLTKIQVVHGATSVAEKTDGIGNGGTFDFTVNYPLTTNSTFTAKVTDDTQSIVSKNTGTFTFVYPIYHGALNSDVAPTEEQIKALTKHIESKGTKTYSFTTNNERFVFAYPKSYGALSSIYDQNNFNVTDTFAQYTVPEMTKEIVEEYVSNLRKVYPRAAKDVFLMIRQILQYAKKRDLIKEIPDFELKFPKKKRSKKTKLVYLPADRQPIWLDILENDGREFCKLFATLLQTGMRPEEGCGLLLSNILFDQDMIYVGNAHKDITIYDEEFNIIGHEYIDDELKTDESYREIPMSSRLKKMLKAIYKERKELREKEHKKFDPSKEHVFLNTIGTPYLPERLDKKLKSIIKKYNLEHMTVYGFRHSFATLMSENGMDKEVLREIMGHADFETTDFYYIYISDKRKKEEFNKANAKASKEVFDKLYESTGIDANNVNTENKKKAGYTGKKIIRRKIKALTPISA